MSWRQTALDIFFAPKSNADGRRLEWQQDKLLRYRLVLFMASLLACIVYRALISEESSMRTTRVGQSDALWRCEMRRSQIISAINLCSNLEQLHSLRKRPLTYDNCKIWDDLIPPVSLQ